MAGGMVSASDWGSDLGACKLQHTQALSAAIDGREERRIQQKSLVV